MSREPGWASHGESVSFDRALLALYAGTAASPPWREFLQLACEQLDAGAATLMLRQPARGDRGDLFSVNTVLPLEELYRTTQFSDDPFIDLEEGVACSIPDRIERETFLRSRYYNELLKPDYNVDILAINVAFAGSYTGSLRLTRREPARPFGLLEKSFLTRLYPHLKCALELFERSRRTQLENDAYVRAIDQLAFGVIIINERGHVVRVNETASRMMRESALLRVIGSHLHAVSADDEAMLAGVLQSILSGADAGAHQARSLKLARQHGSLYVLLKPIAGGEETTRVAGIAAFLSGDKRHRYVAIEPFAKLYGLSRAEVALVTELLEGSSIVDVAGILGISENTARAQLRSVFTKTCVHRQTDLIRLVLTSLTILA